MHNNLFSIIFNTLIRNERDTDFLRDISNKNK